MPNNLKRIRVSGFKSIKELDLELNALNVLIGANGSGKSNFISLFRLLNEILENRLQIYTGTVIADTLLYYGRKTTSDIKIALSFDTNGYEISLIATDDGRLIFSDETIWYHDKQQYPDPYTKTIGEGHQETNLYLESKKKSNITIADYVIERLRSWKIYHFHDTSRSSKMKQAQNINDNERLQPDASNIAAYLYLLKQKYNDHYKRIIRKIRRVAPFFDDFVLRPNPLNEDTILLHWRDLHSDNLFNVHTLSDGTLRFICLATLLLQPDEKLPSVILIDEPELGLHPFAINILAALLESASTKTQVIISTQSVPLINQFAPEDILVVSREDRQSTFERLDISALSEWLEEYNLGELWEKNIIGGRPQRESI